MKKILIALWLISMFAINAKGQTAIEKKTAEASSVLDFASGTTKGIILPAVEVLPTTPANGTFLFSKIDAKIKMYQNGVWVNLTDSGTVAGVVPYSGTVDNAKQTIMGSRTTKVYDGSGNYVDGVVDGVLVLESPNKALVLPKVANPHLTVKSPYAGMMCYDTVEKALAVFDGTRWSYWK